MRNNVQSYKKMKSLEERLQESTKMREKYPNTVPVIVEQPQGTCTLPPMDKKKFLVPKELQLGKYISVIRKRMLITPIQAIFVFVGNNILPRHSDTMGNIYNAHKDEDGFLYITYNGENTFG